MTVRFDDLNPLCSWDSKGNVTPENGRQSFGTFEKLAPGVKQKHYWRKFTLVLYGMIRKTQCLLWQGVGDQVFCIYQMNWIMLFYTKSSGCNNSFCGKFSKLKKIINLHFSLPKIVVVFFPLTEIFLSPKTNCLGTKWKGGLFGKFNVTCSCTQSGECARCVCVFLKLIQLSINLCSWLQIHVIINN